MSDRVLDGRAEPTLVKEAETEKQWAQIGVEDVPGILAIRDVEKLIILFDTRPYPAIEPRP